MNIQTVKSTGNSYLVNGEMVVPREESNAHYIKVQQWLAAGNPLEAEFTEAELLAQQHALASSECTRRINAKWDPIGQMNASLGIYSDEECDACADWIAQHREALAVILEREDLIDLEVENDQYWPV
ncbi:hypothetical protein [Marinomonas transparens]|uniref:DUF4376 domain-containing protein n=1 Tax=Marinomonas transparens TaxID=2795388 RepID=A0A934JU87_9GAMM|nr:hypothetical protein [Marinomonas transparens]MBJ7537147.1 hypothetical protein [Marinomonas transparens]